MTSVDVTVPIGPLPTQVHPWATIRYKLINELDASKIWFDEARNLSKNQLGNLYSKVKDASSLFDALESNFEENDMLDFLINLFEYMEFHDYEYENVAQKIKEYKDRLKTAKQERLNAGIWMDSNFVGREKEIKDITDTILHGKFKGVSLCGLGGMGKTSIANQVCLQLSNISPQWYPKKVDLREQKTVLDLFRVARTQLEVSDHLRNINEAGERSMWNIDEEINIFINDICEIKSRYLILFDNIDDIMESQGETEKLLRFFCKLLKQLDSVQSKVVVMLTCRQKLLSVDRNFNLMELLEEKEIKQLPIGKAEELFNKCTEKATYPISSGTCKEILEICGYCPLAIRAICSILKSGCMAAEDLVQSLKVHSSTTDVMNMKNCLEQTFRRLSKHYQKKLLTLNLFTTAKFSLDGATAVLEKEHGRKYKYSTVLDLVYLKGQHLLEVSDEAFGTTGKYSLHPLVHRYLKEEQEENSLFKEEMMMAKERFISYYCDLAVKSADALRKDPKTVMVMVDEISHLRRTYDFLTCSPESLSLVHQSDKSACMSKIVELSNYILSGNHEKFELYKTFIRHSEKHNDIIEMMRWKTELAKLLFELDKTSEGDHEAVGVLDMCNTHSKIFTDSNPSSKPVLAHFLFVYGRILNKQRKHDEALKSLKQAEDIYMGLSNDPWYKTDLADVYNTMGCIFYNSGDMENSLSYHQKALELGTEDLNKANFLANIGTCYFWLGQEASDREKVERYRDAEKNYNTALTLELRDDDRKAKKLINRSKLYRTPEMKKFEQGWEDVEDAVKILEKCLIPPHESLTIGYHEKGDFLRYWGENCCRENNKNEAKRHYQEAAKCYDKVTEQLKIGGLSTTHDLYVKIVENHRGILKKLHEKEQLEKVNTFYADLESGKYERRAQRARSIEETMEISKTKQAFGSLMGSQELSGSSDDDETDMTLMERDVVNSDSSIESSMDSLIEDQKEKGRPSQTGSKPRDVKSEGNEDGKFDLESILKTRQDSGIGESLGSSEGYSSQSSSDTSSLGRWRESRPILTSIPSGSIEEEVFSETVSIPSAAGDVKQQENFSATDLQTFEEILKKPNKRRRGLKRQTSNDEEAISSSKRKQMDRP